jgi:hypothetical protein
MGNTSQSCCGNDRKALPLPTGDESKKPKSVVTVRRARNAAEVRACHYAWADAENWHPGINETDVFFELDTNGWFIAECDGEPAA